jgi:hypothetical protein
MTEKKPWVRICPTNFMDRLIKVKTEKKGKGTQVIMTEKNGRYPFTSEFGRVRRI